MKKRTRQFAEWLFQDEKGHFPPWGWAFYSFCRLLS